MNLSIPKSHIGAYANIARHNVFLILNDIAIKAGQPQTDKESLFVVGNRSKLPTFDKAELQHPVLAALKGTDKVVQTRIIELLYFHFPFLKSLSFTLYADNPSPDKYYNLLSIIFYSLEVYRNYYTHVHHSEVTINPYIVRYINDIFDDAISIAKERFNLNEDELTSFRRWIGKNKENSSFKYKFADKHDTLNETGLAFILCLFLENDHVFKLLAKLKGLDNKIVKEIFCIHNCRMPQNKIKSDSGKDALLLNILNELQRCPVELFNHLSEGDKKFFITKEIDELNNAPESVLVRKKNKFRDYALRYIEYTNSFTKLRPQLDLGKLVFHRYYKTGPDREQYIRRWEKNIHVFGKLSDIENNYPEMLTNLSLDPALITDTSDIPYHIATNPHYHFIDKNIGFKIIEDSPLINPFKKKIDKSRQTEVEIPVNTQPDLFICTDELTGLLFYDYLSNKYAEKTSAEEIIIKFVENIRRFLKDVATGIIAPISEQKILNQYQDVISSIPVLSKKKFKTQYKDRKSKLEEMMKEYQLSPHMIPDKLCKYLMGVEQVSEQDKADFILKKLIKDTEDLLSASDTVKKGDKNRKKEKREKRKQHVRAGDRATFLARDLLYFQPHTDANGQDAPNPDEYKKLQAALAFFSRDREHIKHVFLLCGLTNSKNPHPFLHKININVCKTNIAFYRQYLAQRKLYLNQCLKENANDNSYATRLHFLNLKKVINNDAAIREYAQNIISLPVNLPRGLFKDNLVSLIQDRGDSEMRKVIQHSTKPNTVYMLNKYFELDGDNSQEFYHYKRGYRIVDEWHDSRHRSNKIEMLQSLERLYKTVDELTYLESEIKQSNRNRIDESSFFSVYAKQVLDNEKLIRHYSACDRMLFIMCKKLIADRSTDSNLIQNLKGQFFLKDIIPDNEKSILNTFINYTMPIKSKNISDKLKIKDYGRLRRFMKDRRLDKLLDYYTKEDISREEIKAELDLYDRKRFTLFETIYDFEIACGEHPGFKKKITEHLQLQSYIKHKTLLEIYNNIFTVDENTIQNLNMIRNAFAHNEVPQKSELKKISFPQSGFTETIASYALSKYEEMINNLKN